MKWMEGRRCTDTGISIAPKGMRMERRMVVRCGAEKAARGGVPGAAEWAKMSEYDTAADLNLAREAIGRCGSDLAEVARSCTGDVRSREDRVVECIRSEERRV